jgi:hypothetical protein
VVVPLLKSALSVEERLKKAVNKRLYKIFLRSIKYTPIILAINEIIFTFLNYYNVHCEYLSYVFGVSFMLLFFLYLMSYIFNFCNIYRVPLYYITAINLIGIYDSIFKISLTDLNMLRLYLILAGLFIIYYIYAEYNKKLAKAIS